MDRSDSELRAGATEALQDSYGPLLTLERIELQLAACRVAFSESRAAAAGEEPAQVLTALKYVVVELRGAQGPATADQAITSLRPPDRRTARSDGARGHR